MHVGPTNPNPPVGKSTSWHWWGRALSDTGCPPTPPNYKPLIQREVCTRYSNLPSCPVIFFACITSWDNIHFPLPPTHLPSKNNTTSICAFEPEDWSLMYWSFLTVLVENLLEKFKADTFRYSCMTSGNEEGGFALGYFLMDLASLVTFTKQAHPLHCPKVIVFFLCPLISFGDLVNELCLQFIAALWLLTFRIRSTFLKQKVKLKLSLFSLWKKIENTLILQ